MLLPDAFLAALNDDELFFLAVACHYHDLAMAGTEADDQSPETREQVRREHAIRIGSIINRRWAELGFDDERTAQVLGEVCRGHRPKKNSEGEANWDELKSIGVLRPNIAVRVRLLSALIYAIDELHLGADRAPARVQSWRNIRDEESRRHWARHQSVNGPCRTPAGSILLQVNAHTPGFEENLRAQVFRKALLAVHDLRRQAETDGVRVPLPTVEVEWDRQSVWKAWLPLVCSDLRPRTEDEIVQALLDRFTEWTCNSTDLTGLCTERGSSENELRAGAYRCVADARTYRHLVVAPEPPAGILLSAEESVAEVLFGRMRDADELDRLFLGRYQARWEDQLFRSPYGRTYIADCVLPVVERSYSVPLTQRAASDPLRVLLESCPSAARLIRTFAPPPSNLVKESLLVQAALTGALYELHADPELLLEPRLRTSVHALGGPVSSITPTLRLLEELALIGGFTVEQVEEAHRLSEAARQAVQSQITNPQERVQITLTQTVSGDAPAATTHLSHLLLASQRARTHIRLTTAPGCVLNVQATPEAALPAPIADTFMVGMGPAEVRPIGPFRLPARVEVSRPSRTVRFYLGRFSAGCPAPYPVVVTIPPPPRPGQQTTVRFGAYVHWPELMVRDLRSLDAANQVLRSDRGRAELLLEGGGELLASMDTQHDSELFRLGAWTGEILRGLRGLDGNLPAPLFVPIAEIAELGRQTASDRNAAWLRLREQPAPGPRRISSLFLRFASDTGVPVEETFLGFFPFNFFPAPTIDGGGQMSPEEFTQRWEAGTDDCVLTMYFQSDIYDLAYALREWSRDPSGEFPFRFLRDEVTFPVTRSALAIRFLRARDRLWHVDRPIVFEFRPVNRAEAYHLEANYWRSVNDHRRAELAEEISARVAGATPVATTEGQPRNWDETNPSANGPGGGGLHTPGPSGDAGGQP
jgi:hypothetical protein